MKNFSSYANQELTGDSAIFLLLLIESHEIRSRSTT
jgi:hypothetical protein